uniref:WD repeat and FYVE domain-containing protein 2 n=1 Tax=Aceria tosichella TaxID=561515 RepID=A0A6G1S5K9_9ACAR
MELVARLEGHDDVINQATILKDEDGILSISNDKTIRIWLKRERGSYWPSVCHLLPFAPTCFHFDQNLKRLFVGLENGTISEFLVTDDFNRIDHQRYFSSHQSKVTSILYSSTCRLLLSVGKDKQFHWDDAESGTRLGSHPFQNSCTAVQFDPQSKHVFVAEQNGQISMLKLEQNSCRHITTLHGHSASIKSLLWDPFNKWLFSAGADKVITCWDIGGCKGTAHELQGHRNRIGALCYSRMNKMLISGGEDCAIIAWNMEAKRMEAPQWSESDDCQRCKRPFFWNFKSMYETKTIGLRQHHCRNCGKAVCGDCSQRRSTIPLLGFEYQVRVCDECFPLFSDVTRKPLAKFFSATHHVNCMDLNESKGMLLTSGYDRTITLWNLNWSEMSVPSR